MKKLLVLFCMVVMLAACGGGDGGGSSDKKLDAEIRAVFPPSDDFLNDGGCALQYAISNVAADESYYVCPDTADFSTYAGELVSAGFTEIIPADPTEGLYSDAVNDYHWEYECDSGLCDVYWTIVH